MPLEQVIKTCNAPLSRQTLPAREVYQVLKDIALGTRTMTRVGGPLWNEAYACHVQIDVDGWALSIYTACDGLDYCQWCVAPDGRRWDFNSSQGFGTDPVELMSTWERATFEPLLGAL